MGAAKDQRSLTECSITFSQCVRSKLQKIEDDGAVSGHTVYEYLDENKHGGRKKPAKKRISVDFYIYGYERDVGKDRWASARCAPTSA